MKKAIFIDRDGTIIFEPPVTEQVNTLEELEFMPMAITSLASLRKLDYELVIASNQDGLGTESYPWEAFDKVNDKMLKILEGEGMTFDDMLFDPSTPEQNSPNRKPGTGMFGKYLDGSYDLSSSYVIGDRLTDILLARNLGAKGILYTSDQALIEELSLGGLSDVCVLATDDWTRIADYIRRGSRYVSIVRNTKETMIRVDIDLDGLKLPSDAPQGIDTGLHFLDHMIDQIVHHAGISLGLKADGDLEVDEHHTIEDVAIVLGQAIFKALGDKRGIRRYGFALPMDECDAFVLMDFGGRIDFQWSVHFTREYVGDVPTEMFRHFFATLCNEMRCNLHIEARGDNNHHLAESVFKAFARTLKTAVSHDALNYELPSSKGLL